MIKDSDITTGHFQSPPFDIYSPFVSGSAFKIFSYDRIDHGGTPYDAGAFIVHDFDDGGFRQTWTVISQINLRYLYWMHMTKIVSRHKNQKRDPLIDDFAFKKFFEWLEIELKEMNIAKDGITVDPQSRPPIA